MTRRGAILPLLLIVLAGLALRAWYASFAPDQGRFWDERYALANVRPILLEGTLLKLESGFYPSPVFNLPPAALLAASDALYRATGDRRFAVHGEGDFTATAYLLVRFLQTVYGTLAILLTYWIGRRLFCPAAALIAAAAVAFAPWLIHSSGYFKPDALLLCTLAFAFLLSLRAVERPGTWRYLLAGAAIALALSAKLTGGFVAVPLVVGTLWGGFREPRRWLRLLAAGGAALLVFFAVNPYGPWYLGLLGVLERDYAMRAGWEEMTRWSVPGRVVALLTGSNVHGPLLGTASLLALAVMAAMVLRRRGTMPAGRRTEWAMLLSFPPVYVLAYLLETPYFKPNNFIPVMLCTSLALGWACVAAHGWLAERFPRLASPAVRGLLWLGLAALIVVPGFSYTHRSVVPSTVDAALLHLRPHLRPPDGRLVWVQAGPVREPPWEGVVIRTRHLAAARVDDLGSVDPRLLELAGAVVFPARELRGPRREFYEALAADRTVLEVPFRLFRSRGATLLASAGSWRLRGRWTLDPAPCGDATACWSADPPATPRRLKFVSATVHFSAGLLPEGAGEPFLEAGSRRLPLVWTDWRAGGHLFTSPRFRSKDGPLRIRLPESAEPRAELSVGPGTLSVDLYGWRRGRRQSAGR